MKILISYDKEKLFNFKVLQNHFLKFGHFLAIFTANDVRKLFYDVATLIWAFGDSADLLSKKNYSLCKI